MSSKSKKSTGSKPLEKRSLKSNGKGGSSSEDERNDDKKPSLVKEKKEVEKKKSPATVSISQKPKKPKPEWTSFFNKLCVGEIKPEKFKVHPLINN